MASISTPTLEFPPEICAMLGNFRFTKIKKADNASSGNKGLCDNRTYDDSSDGKISTDSVAGNTPPIPVKVFKINKAKLKLEEEVFFDNSTAPDIEQLAQKLPENSPRYVVLLYTQKHDDGRISFPLVLINWNPMTCETGMLTLHASGLLPFQKIASVNRVIEIRDVEDFTKSNIDEVLHGK